MGESLALWFWSFWLSDPSYQSSKFYLISIVFQYSMKRETSFWWPGGVVYVLLYRNYWMSLLEGGGGCWIYTNRITIKHVLFREKLCQKSEDLVVQCVMKYFHRKICHNMWTSTLMMRISSCCLQVIWCN